MPSRRALLAGAAGLAGGAGLAETIHLGPIEAVPPPDDTWPQARYGPRNTGANPDADVPADPRIDWQTVELPLSYSSAVVAGPDRVYLGGAGIAAFDRVEGTRRWRLDDPAHHLAIVDGTLFAAPYFAPQEFEADEVGPMAIGAADGSLRWAVRGVEPVYDLATGSNALYVGLHGKLVAYDKRRGNRRWAVSRGWDAETYALLHRGTLYGGLERLARFGSRSLFDVATFSGPPIRWESDYLDEMDVPTAKGDRIFVGSDRKLGSGEPALAAYSIADGQREWEAIMAPDDDVYFDVSSPVVVGGLGFVTIRTEKRDETRYEAAMVGLGAGSVEWRSPVDEPVWDLAAGADTLVLGTGNTDRHSSTTSGSVRALRQGDGTERWRLVTESPVTSVAIVDGTVFASTQRGGVLAIR